jgi:hypothetical protein
MIFRSTKPRRLPGRRLWYYCCMIFTPPLASKFSESIGAGADYETTLVDRDTPTRAYLQVIGPPPLRFQEAVPPPDLAGRPPAAAPPTPSATAATGPKAAAASPPPSVAAVPPVPKPTKAKPPAPVTTAPGDTSEAAAPAIIEDEMRPRVRAEEFLPFFQPGQIPPSSATYEKR